MRPFFGFARSAANAVAAAESGGPGGLRLLRGRGAKKVAAVQQRSVRPVAALAKPKPISLEPLPLQNVVRSKFPRLAAKFSTYRAVSGPTPASNRLFKPYENIAARLERPKNPIKAPMMPMSSTILSYSPALRSGIVPAGRMPFSTMASIARAGFASSNSKSQGWAKYSALGLLFLNGDDETNNKPVDLRVRRAPKELRNKSHKIAGGFKKSTASSSNGLVRSSVQMRAALSRASFKEIMRQIQISRSSNVALTISLYGYNVWDLEGFIPSSMLWAGAAGSVPITPRSLDCLRRALDPDGTLAKTIACLEVFGGFGHADRVLFETHDNGELTLKLTFPPGVSEADVRQLLWDSGLDPDDHIFELASSRPTEEEPTINVVFFAPGPPKEMGFDDWFDVADQAMCDESWLDVPPSETQSFAGVRGARPDESIISENVWVDL